MRTERQSVEFAGGNLAGRHICAFFNSTDEQHRVLRSFIKDGFDRGDKVFHLVNPDLREEHLRHLTDAGIDVQKVSASGQLEVRSWKDTYLRGDRFDQDAMLALVEEVLQTGHTEGYSLTRLLAQMEWALVDKQGVEDLLEYETRINYVIPKYDDIVICTYDLSKFSASVVIDAMRTHPAVIVGGLLHENPFFVPPEQFLLEIKERQSLRKSAGMTN
jgi:hypothetical protein